MAFDRVIPDSGLGQTEPPDELGAQTFRLHDGVDDELGREVHEVDVLFVLGLVLRHERGALVGILDRLDAASKGR